MWLGERIECEVMHGLLSVFGAGAAPAGASFREEVPWCGEYPGLSRIADRISESSPFVLGKFRITLGCSLIVTSEPCCLLQVYQLTKLPLHSPVEGILRLQWDWIELPSVIGISSQRLPACSSSLCVRQASRNVTISPMMGLVCCQLPSLLLLPVLRGRHTNPRLVCCLRFRRLLLMT